MIKKNQINVANGYKLYNNYIIHEAMFKIPSYLNNWRIHFMQENTTYTKTDVFSHSYTTSQITIPFNYHRRQEMFRSTKSNFLTRSL